MYEQSVLSFDNIPLCEIEEISPIGSKGNLATTIPYISKKIVFYSYLIDVIEQTHEKHHE